MTYHKSWFFSGNGYVFESGFNSEVSAKRGLYNFLRNNYYSLGYNSFEQCKKLVGSVFVVDYDVVLY